LSHFIRECQGVSLASHKRKPAVTVEGFTPQTPTLLNRLTWNLKALIIQLYKNNTIFVII
jgi:hypothetical protein